MKPSYFILSQRKRKLISQKSEAPMIKTVRKSIVALCNIKKGEKFSKENIWVKRPGTGEIKAAEYKNLLGKSSRRIIGKNVQLKGYHIK